MCVSSMRYDEKEEEDCTIEFLYASVKYHFLRMLRINLIILLEKHILR